MADALSCTRVLPGNFEVREVSPEDIPEEVLRGNPSAIRASSHQQTPDYIVFGSVRVEKPGYDIDAAVRERGSGAISVREARRARSLFDTFSVADERVVESLTGQEAGDALPEVLIMVRKDGVTSLSFTMASPAGGPTSMQGLPTSRGDRIATVAGVPRRPRVGGKRSRQHECDQGV